MAEESKGPSEPQYGWMRHFPRVPEYPTADLEARLKTLRDEGSKVSVGGKKVQLFTREKGQDALDPKGVGALVGAGRVADLAAALLVYRGRTPHNKLMGAIAKHKDCGGALTVYRRAGGDLGYWRYVHGDDGVDVGSSNCKTHPGGCPEQNMAVQLVSLHLDVGALALLMRYGYIPDLDAIEHTTWVRVVLDALMRGTREDNARRTAFVAMLLEAWRFKRGSEAITRALTSHQRVGCNGMALEWRNIALVWPLINHDDAATLCLLLDKGVRADGVQWMGSTAALHAARRGATACAQLLAVHDRGQDVLTKRGCYDTVCHWSCALPCCWALAALTSFWWIPTACCMTASPITAARRGGHGVLVEFLEAVKESGPLPEGEAARMAWVREFNARHRSGVDLDAIVDQARVEARSVGAFVEAAPVTTPAAATPAPTSVGSGAGVAPSDVPPPSSAPAAPASTL